MNTRPRPATSLPPCRAEGLFGAGRSLAIFKHDANESAILFNPTGLLYLRNAPPQPPAAGISGRLSAAGVAGVAVGATVAATLLAGVPAVLLLRRRRRRHRALAAAKRLSSLESSATPPFASEGASAAPPSSQLPSAFSAEVASPFAATAVTAAAAAALRPAASGALPRAASTATLEGAGSGPPQAVPELLQLIAAVDAAASPQPGATTGSSSSRASSGAEAAARLPPAHAMLPVAMRAFVVDPAELEYCRLPGGKLHELGAGARWVDDGVFCLQGTGGLGGVRLEGAASKKRCLFVEGS